MASTVLVVDDEPAIRDSIEFALHKEGHRVVTAADGWEAIARFRESAPELVILDVMMPEMSGLEVCRTLRAESRVPIILLTVRSTEIDLVTGLDMGADDYMTKPFSLRELAARARAQLRRGSPLQEASVLKAADVEVDTTRRIASVAGQDLALSTKEFELLSVLVQNAGLALSRNILLERVWGMDFEGETRTLDMHISRLREKLEQVASSRPIETLRGYGYRFRNE